MKFYLAGISGADALKRAADLRWIAKLIDRVPQEASPDLMEIRVQLERVIVSLFEPGTDPRYFLEEARQLVCDGIGYSEFPTDWARLASGLRHYAKGVEMDFSPESKSLSPDEVANAMALVQESRRIFSGWGLRLRELKKRGTATTEENQRTLRAVSDSLAGYNRILCEIFGEGSKDARKYEVRPEPDDGVLQVVEMVLAQSSHLLDVLSRGTSAADTANVAPVPVGPAAGQVEPPPGRRVFVVHGHDEGAKEKVARFLEQLSLEAVILHEKPNEGGTLIQKLEKHSAVDYAVVLLTPDDLGRPKVASVEQPRARQNVVLELGYFIGRLTRPRICLLLSPELEMPSDLQGLAWHKLDADGGWRQKLYMEIATAGLPVDARKFLGSEPAD